MVDRYQRRGARDARWDPADLRHRLRPRRREHARRDRLPAQHRPRRHARPGPRARVEHITAEETRSTGPQWSFSPCICAARDDRWGRTYESFSEDPRLVEKFETAIDGYQGGARPAQGPRPRARHRQALRGRRRHRVRHRQRRLHDRPGHHGHQPQATSGSPRSASTCPPCKSTTSTGHAVLLERRLDRGRRRQPAEHARSPRADHRRAQGQARLQGLRDQRLQRPQPHQPGPARDQHQARRHRRHRHVHGAGRRATRTSRPR